MQLGSWYLYDAFTNNYKPIIDSNYIVTKISGINKTFGTRPTIKNNIIIIYNMVRGIIDYQYSDSAKVL